VLRVCDVELAGLHRLHRSLCVYSLPDVDVIITVAGMDGALPSVCGRAGTNCLSSVTNVN